jgi:YbbR domain-containing protein
MERKIITISLIVSFSILLWVFVSFSEDFSITLNLPTQVIAIPENNSVSSVSSDEVTISIKGQGWQLAQHTLGRDPKFFIPCPTEKGTQEVSARNVIHANTWLSTSLQLVEISPEKIKITVEPTKTKKVEIIPVVSLTFKPGYGLVSPILIEPDSVEITGPKSLVEEINIINTENKIITKLESETSLILNIENPKYLLTNISECKISFDVQKIVDKTFEDLDVQTLKIPSRYELILLPNKINVVIRGGIIQLSKMKKEDLNVFVKFEQALNDTGGAIEPIIEIPEFTSLVDIKPNRLEYIIKKY